MNFSRTLTTVGLGVLAVAAFAGCSGDGDHQGVVPDVTATKASWINESLLRNRVEQFGTKPLSSLSALANVYTDSKLGVGQTAEGCLVKLNGKKWVLDSDRNYCILSVPVPGTGSMVWAAMPVKPVPTEADVMSASVHAIDAGQAPVFYGSFNGRSEYGYFEIYDPARKLDIVSAPDNSARSFTLEKVLVVGVDGTSRPLRSVVDDADYALLVEKVLRDFEARV